MAMISHGASGIENQTSNPRVEDYLDDKFQNTVDLENIDLLLNGVLEQQTLLRQQLDQAQNTFAEREAAAEKHAAKLLQDVRAFDRRQGEIDRRLLIITQSDTSDEAIRKFDNSMSQLRRLDVAKGYVSTLQEVDKLRLQALEQLRNSPKDALKPCMQIRNIALALQESQLAAEQAAPHLVDYVQQTATDLCHELESTISGNLEEILAKMKWPGKDMNLTDDLKQAWKLCADQLLDFQRPELERREIEIYPSRAKEEPRILLPLKVMMKSLQSRFEYHFSGDRPTNKLDKPEYFLAHIAELLNTYEPFFTIHLQPILTSMFRSSPLTSKSVYIDATSAYITALLPLLRSKFRELLPKYNDRPRLLSHFMHELLLFDSSLRDEWGYDGGDSVDGWNGLAGEVLVKMGYFNRWLDVEKTYALSRYESIISASDAKELDKDSVAATDTKPTNAAVRVNDLLEAVTDIYRPLTSFYQRLQFLIEVQLSIFDRYHQKQASILSAYNPLMVNFGKAVPTAMRKDVARENLTDMSALETLARVYGSADFLEHKMADWSDDVFFIDLWEELEDRAKRNTKPRVPGSNALAPSGVTATPTTPGFNVTEVASKTSKTLNDDDTIAQGALFDEITTSYRQLRVRAEEYINKHLATSLTEALKLYRDIDSWSALSSTTSGAATQGVDQELSISSQLDSPLQLLSMYLSYLASVLGTAPLRRIGRQLALSIQSTIWKTVTSKSFSKVGAAQLRRDVFAMCGVMDRYLGGGQSEQGMQKVVEALTLLVSDAGYSSQDEDEDLSAWDEDAEIEESADKAGADRMGEESSKPLTLQEVKRRLFRDEDSAGIVLNEMGISSLSIEEARKIVERRVDAAD